MDWLDPWPPEALGAVGLKVLEDVELESPAVSPGRPLSTPCATATPPPVTPRLGSGDFGGSWRRAPPFPPLFLVSIQVQPTSRTPHPDTLLFWWASWSGIWGGGSQEIPW